MKRISTLLRTLRRARDVADPTAEPGLSIAQLFDATHEATLIIDAASGSIVEANPAAAELLGRRRERLIGAPWLGAFSGGSALGLTKLESVAQTAGVAAAVRVTPCDGARELDVALSLVRSAPSDYLIAHLTAAQGSQVPVSPPQAAPLSIEVLAKAAEGFVVTDPGLRVLYANQAFARLAGLRGPPDVVGKSLTRWIEFTQADLDGLAAQMGTREATTVIRTALRPSRPQAAAPAPVELTAVAVPDDPQRCFGFWVREAGGPGAAAAVLPAAGREP